MNGWEGNSPIYMAKEFLNSCQDNDKSMNVHAKKLWNFNKINEVALEQMSISDEYVKMSRLLQVYINCNCNSQNSMN
jgi:hypothetical protein